jgi:hypothetical protein
MSAAARALTQLAYLEIFKKQNKTLIDVKAWVANQNYYVDSGMTPTSFTLTVHDPEGLQAALANDCNRMSMAAIESICGVHFDSIFSKSSAWAAIRAYYASFFAAHAILRVFGYSYSQLEFEHTKKIFEVAETLNVHGVHRKIENGFYCIQIDRAFRKIKFERKKESHKDMWRGFLTLIEQLANDITQTSAISKHKIEAIDLLYEARKGVTKNGSNITGNWLSELRNQVNYKHSNGTWHPNEMGVAVQRAIATISSQWKKPSETFSITGKQQEMELFFESTTLLLSFMREMLCECADKVGDKKTVFQLGALRMLRSTSKRRMG